MGIIQQQPFETSTGAMDDDNMDDNDDLLMRVSSFLDEQCFEAPVAPATLAQRRCGAKRPAPLQLGAPFANIRVPTTPSATPSTPFSTLRFVARPTTPPTPASPLSPFSDLRIPAAQPSTPTPTSALVSSVLLPLSALFANPEQFVAESDVNTIALAILRANAAANSPTGSLLLLAAATKPDKATQKQKQKQKQTYLQLCALALFDVGDGAAVNQVYEWIARNHPAYAASKFWKNAVRHALSAGECYTHDGNARWTLLPHVRTDLAMCQRGTTPRYLNDKRKEPRPKLERARKPKRSAVDTAAVAPASSLQRRKTDSPILAVQ